MTDEKFVGKILDKDFTLDDLHKEYPEFEIIRVYEIGKMAVATFNPKRLRVWVDSNKKVEKIISG